MKQYVKIIILMSDKTKFFISTVILLIGFYFLGIGIYEGVMASKNTYNDSSLIIQLYAFTVAKTVINILSSITLIISSVKLYLSSSDSSSKDNKQSKGSAITASLGISIWGLVLWFNEMNNIPNNYSDYINVLNIEFYTFWIILGLAVFVLCGGICFLFCSK